MSRLKKVLGAMATIAIVYTTSAASAAPQWCSSQRNFNAAERTVCQSRQLSLLDSRLGAAYSGARSANPSGRNEIKQYQRDWLGRRNDCGTNRGCLVRRYEEQIDWLDGYGGHSVDPEPVTGGEDDAINPWRTRGYRRCFNFVMSGRVQWGGGTQWRRENAAWLCEASTDDSENPPEPVYCFRQQRNKGLDWESAVQLCRENRGLVGGSAQQTEINRRNGAPPQRMSNTADNDDYDPSEENDGYDEPVGNQDDDDGDDTAGGNPYCGWWAIYSCHRSRNRAINDMNNAGYGGVVHTNDVPNFRPGYYCVADGPFPRKRRAQSDYPSAYVKNGC